MILDKHIVPLLPIFAIAVYVGEAWVYFKVIPHHENIPI